MTYQFTVSPDFSPAHIAGWHIFNTWLQKQLSEAIHFEMYDSFDAQRQTINEGKVDLIYANPYDAAMLVRDKGFIALARPIDKPDEAMVVVNSDSVITTIEELQAGINIAYTDDPDVKMMGMIMLEPADLNASNITMTPCNSYILVAKQLLQGTCDVGFFLEESFHDLSSMVKQQLRALVTSQIYIIQHSLLLGPAFAERQDDISQILLSMTNDEKGRGVLESMGIKAWEHLEQEDVEFMIDLMSTLVE